MRYLPGLVSHELHVLFDVINVLLILFGRVCVIETEIALSVVHLGQHEVKPHGFAVPDVQVAVGLGREAGVDGVSELLLMLLHSLFGVVGGLHLSADQGRKILNLECLFLLWLILLFSFLILLLLFSNDLVREASLFPDIFKQVFEQFSFD